MLTKKQQEMDIKKWNDSQKAGYDTCGTYDFCSKCNKSLENPCDKAVKASKTVKPAAKKSTAKKSAK
ncbi:MAG: hypothetical protein K2O35_01545 [Clostridia bacterium]|nr:hypothetical protein [Clostridia bacterium]